MGCRGTEGFFPALLEVRCCALGVCLSLNVSLDIIWGAGRGFIFDPHLIPGRPFSPCVMSQFTLLMGKAVELSAKTGIEPWENRNWRAPWTQ